MQLFAFACGKALKERLAAPPQWGEFVTYCQLLSKDITRTETAMEKGTTSFDVIALDSNWTTD
jgi:hypothetical protein